MIKVVKNKTELNRFIKEFQTVWPEAVIEKTTPLVTIVSVEGFEVISALKCRGGYSIMCQDHYFDTRSQEDKIKSLETSLTNN